MAWEPIVVGARAAELHALVRELGDRVGEDRTAAALFWAYAAGVWDDDETARRYDAAVDRLVEQLASAPASHALIGGLAGAGWVIAHVASDAEDVLAPIDAALLADVQDAGLPYDLISGLVGIGVYFVARGDRDGVAAVVAQLAALQVTTAAGTAWRTPLHHIPAERRAAWPAGYFDCGLAHGVPGVIALLGKAVELGVGDARPLLDGALRWLAMQRAGSPETGIYPAFAGAAPTRTAWCYGDAGVAVATWNALARAGGSLADARQLAEHVAQRAPDATKIVDATLCHGAAGLAHLMNRCYQASREPGFRDAAIAWLDRALAMRETWAGGDLLEGLPGIGLVLLAATTAEEPRWDAMLLCDLPVAP
ncbi:MAG TPA: lanthionine synthetase C family protein [Kofleriaceae bacterium]|nr:lanthionine synthetase C family protein [Kofleriaceae bacterium]